MGFVHSPTPPGRGADRPRPLVTSSAVDPAYRMLNVFHDPQARTHAADRRPRPNRRAYVSPLRDDQGSAGQPVSSPCRRTHALSAVPFADLGSRAIVPVSRAFGRPRAPTRRRGAQVPALLQSTHGPREQTRRTGLPEPRVFAVVSDRWRPKRRLTGSIRRGRTGARCQSSGELSARAGWPPRRRRGCRAVIQHRPMAPVSPQEDLATRRAERDAIGGRSAPLVSGHLRMATRTPRATRGRRLAKPGPAGSGHARCAPANAVPSRGHPDLIALVPRSIPMILIDASALPEMASPCCPMTVSSRRSPSRSRGHEDSEQGPAAGASSQRPFSVSIWTIALPCYGIPSAWSHW